MMVLLTYLGVEEAIKKWVETKAKTYGQQMLFYADKDEAEADPVYKIKQVWLLIYMRIRLCQ